MPTPLWPLPSSDQVVTQVGSELVVFRATDGSRVWSFEIPLEGHPVAPTSPRIVCSPVVADDVLLVRTEESLITLSLGSGALRRRDSMIPIERFDAPGCPVSWRERAYLVASEEGRRISMRSADGVVRWTTELPGAETAMGQPRVLSNGDIVLRTNRRVIVFSQDGDIEQASLLAESLEFKK